MKELQFHQFIKRDRGPVNTLLINFFDNNIYHVENEIIDQFMQKKHSKSVEDFLIQNNLAIFIDKKSWIPDYMKILTSKSWYSRLHHGEINIDDIFFKHRK